MCANLPSIRSARCSLLRAVHATYRGRIGVEPIRFHVSVASATQAENPVIDPGHRGFDLTLTCMQSFLHALRQGLLLQGIDA